MLGELAGTLTLLAETRPGVFAEIGMVAATTFGGPNQSAHLHLSPDDAWALASNRGPDTVAPFNMSSGMPELLEECWIGNGWPTSGSSTATSTSETNMPTRSSRTSRTDLQAG